MNKLLSSVLVRAVTAATSNASKIMLLIERSVNKDRIKNAFNPSNRDILEIPFYNSRAVQVSHWLDQLSRQETVQQNVMVPKIFDTELCKVSEHIASPELPLLNSTNIKSNENLEDIDRDAFYDDFYNIDDTENEVEDVFVKNHVNEQKGDLNDSKLPGPHNAESILPIKWSTEDIGFSAFVNFARIIDPEDPKMHSIEQNLDVIEEVGLGRAEFLLYKSHPGFKSLQCI